MRRAVQGALAAGLVAVVAPAHADLFGTLLGRGPARPASATVVSYPTPAARPAWEAYLQEGNAEAGKALYEQGQTLEGRQRVLACQTCHGAGGVPQLGAPMPRLAGVTADYIAKQLDHYKAGRRKNAVMQQIAQSLSPADMGSAALHLASLSPAKWDNPPRPGNDAGRVLQELGDNARAIPACGSCHGPQGRGTDQLLPPLAGLSASYLRTQMREWRSGERSNDDAGLMRAIAAELTDEEIVSLSEYYASMR